MTRAGSTSAEPATPTRRTPTTTDLAFTPVAAQQAVLHELADSLQHRDACLVGPAGQGKSAVVQQLAAHLGQSTRVLPLFKVN